MLENDGRCRVLRKCHKYLRSIGRYDIINARVDRKLAFLESLVPDHNFGPIPPTGQGNNRRVRMNARFKNILDILTKKNKVKRFPEPPNKKYINDNEQVDEFYKSFEWRKLRYKILAKYGRKCMACGTTTGQIHVDHIKPLRRYWHLRLVEDNLQILCEDCNHGKGSWDETDWRPKSPLPRKKLPKELTDLLEEGNE